MEYWKQELYHHGILGQKWGKRHGPPYPLGSGRDGHTAEERRIGWRKSLNGKTNENLYDRNEAKQARIRYWKEKGYSKPPAKKEVKTNSEKAKKTGNRRIDKEKLIKIGKIAAATAVISIGTYVLYKNGSFDKLVNAGKEALSARKKYIPLVDVWGINGGIGSYGTGPKNSSGIPLNTVNCQACTLAFELRNRGFTNVTARAIDTRTMTSYDMMSKFYKNVSMDDFIDCKSIGDLTTQANLLPPGARGNFLYNSLLGGHSMAFEKTVNGFHVIDAQNGTVYNSLKDVYKTYGEPDGVTSIMSLFRTDNLELNDIAFIEQYISGMAGSIL